MLDLGFYVFFFNDTATTEIYTLSLHDALPISGDGRASGTRHDRRRHQGLRAGRRGGGARDRKSTRLNSSHSQISYAVFCLKKKTNPRWMSKLEAGFSLSVSLTEKPVWSPSPRS